jgi:hypothetical protein
VAVAPALSWRPALPLPRRKSLRSVWSLLLHKLGEGVKEFMGNFLVSGAGVQSRTLGFQGKNLQERPAEVVDAADGLANSGRQENEVRGRQAGADNLPRAIAINVLNLPSIEVKNFALDIYSPRLYSSLGPLNPKRFLRPLARRKFPKASLLEAESTLRRHGSKNFAEKVFFLHFESIPFDC